MNELQTYIGNYFQIGQEYLDQIAALFEEQHLDRQQFHTRQESYHSPLSFVKSGFLRVYRVYEGREVTQWIATEGEFITELSTLMFEQPARWQIQAMTDCVLHTISKENYQKIGLLVPQWEVLEKRFISKCFIALEERVFQFLSLPAEERLQALLTQKKGIMNQVPLQYIASMLGMTPETLSRIRKKMIS